MQCKGNKLTQLELASGRETVVLQSGRDAGLDASVILSSPVVSPRGTIALALDGRRRGTLVIATDGEVRSAGSGCQLNWGPGFTYLYKVDHGGVQKNAIYRMDRNALKPEIWLDAPRRLSYEYFPKVSNTGDVMDYGAGQGAHEHDTADYDIFLWRIGRPSGETRRLTCHTGNDCWPDIFLTN